MTDILEATVRDLQACKGRWKQISLRSGIPYDTLTKIAQGRVQNPRILTLERIRAAVPRRRTLKASASA